ncbi:MAG: RsmE family RNA methyltransferase [Aquificaceae bacterium]
MSAILGGAREGKYVKVEGDRLKHIRALRFKRGDECKLIVEGELFRCKLIKLAKDYVLFETIESLGKREAKRQIAVFQAITEDLRFMDVAIDVLSQAGAKELIPVFVKRGISPKVQIDKRLLRWQRIALASMQQCERSEPLYIKEPIKLEDISPKGQGIALSLNAKAGIKNLEPTQEISIFVGPEGGLDSSEEELLETKGFIKVKLEPFVIKSAFAGAFACSIVQNL